MNKINWKNIGKCKLPGFQRKHLCDKKPTGKYRKGNGKRQKYPLKKKPPDFLQKKKCGNWILLQILHFTYTSLI